METCEDPNRHARPARLETQGGALVVHGYQEFALTRGGIRVLDTDPVLNRKRELLGAFFTPRYLAERRVLDLGANAGFFSFWALQAGAAAVTAVELDPQYVAMMEQVRAHLSFGALKVVRGRVGDWREPADIVLALALVHWVYSCRETFGSVDAIVEWLAGLASYMVVVEWVDPEDEAIQPFGHLKWNRQVVSGPYSSEEFERSLARHFARYALVGHVSPTRRVYVAFRTPHEIDLSGPLPLLGTKERVISRRLVASWDGVEYWSCVYDGGDRIYKQATLDLAWREAELLACLKGEHFPRVLEARREADYSVVVLEKIVGVALRQGIGVVRQSRDSFGRFVRHCLEILKELRCAGIVHRDVCPENILLRQGAPVLIDFGWAIQEGSSFLTPPGLGRSQRALDGSFCDVYSMGKVLEEASDGAFPECDRVLTLMTQGDPSLRVRDPHVLLVLFEAALGGPLEG